ncbi:MAG: hypothetical protein ACK48C_00410, partial [Roseiflexaceae bacterium]
MAKTRTVFVCQQCGAHQAREMGRCPNCGGWGTLVEQIERRDAPSSTRRSVVVSGGGAPTPLNAIPSGGAFHKRNIPPAGGAVEAQLFFDVAHPNNA